MEINEIQADWIAEALKNFVDQKPLPSCIQQLDCVVGDSIVEKERLFIALLHIYIADKLEARRDYCNVIPLLEPHTRQTDLKNISQDAAARDQKLAMWSFLYYRFVSDLDLRVKEMSIAAFASENDQRRKLKDGCKMLEIYVCQREDEAHKRLRMAQFHVHAGAPDYAQYIGMEILLGQITNQLIDKEGPRWISLEGIGGIGKTALARRIVEDLTQHRSEIRVIWLSARQSYFNAQTGIQPLEHARTTTKHLIEQLWQKSGQKSESPVSVTQMLHQLALWCSTRRLLIVIDNLETVREGNVMKSFYPLAGETRFLITSRKTLKRFPFVKSQRIPELSRLDSEMLLRGEYERLNQSTLMLTPENVKEVYETIGGVPLAIKLMAAQLGSLPIEVCLEGLRDSSQRKRSKEMFTYVYRQTWRLLAPEARSFLLAIHDTIPPEGVPRAWLVHIASAIQISTDTLDEILEQLMYYSLLEIDGESYSYHLHRLTITFLQNEFRASQIS